MAGSRLSPRDLSLDAVNGQFLDKDSNTTVTQQSSTGAILTLCSFQALADRAPKSNLTLDRLFLD